MPGCANLMVVALLMAAVSRMSGQGDDPKNSLQQRLNAQFALTKITADRSDIVTTGTYAEALWALARPGGGKFGSPCYAPRYPHRTGTVAVRVRPVSETTTGPCPPHLGTTGRQRPQGAEPQGGLQHGARQRSLKRLSTRADFLTKTSRMLVLWTFHYIHRVGLLYLTASQSIHDRWNLWNTGRVPGTLGASVSECRDRRRARHCERHGRLRRQSGNHHRLQLQPGWRGAHGGIRKRRASPGIVHEPERCGESACRLGGGVVPAGGHQQQQSNRRVPHDIVGGVSGATAHR